MVDPAITAVLVSGAFALLLEVARYLARRRAEARQEVRDDARTDRAELWAEIARLRGEAAGMRQEVRQAEARENDWRDRYYRLRDRCPESLRDAEIRDAP